MAYTQQTPIGTPDVNLITKTLAGLQPDSALQQYAMLHKNNPYILSLAKSESDRRRSLRMAAQGNPGQMPTVADREIAGMAQQQLPENQGIAQIPTPNMQSMADGGIAGYADDEEGMATGGMGGMFNFAQQSEPVVRMSGGGHIPRYQGNTTDGSVVNSSDPQLLALKAKYEKEATEMGEGTRLEFSPDVKVFAQQLYKPEKTAQEAYLAKEQKQMLEGNRLRNKTQDSASMVAPTAPTAPTASAAYDPTENLKKLAQTNARYTTPSEPKNAEEAAMLNRYPATMPAAKKDDAADKAPAAAPAPQGNLPTGGVSINDAQNLGEKFFDLKGIKGTLEQQQAQDRQDILNEKEARAEKLAAFNKEQGPAMAGYEKLLKSEEMQDATDKEKAGLMSLMKGFLAMAAGESPNAATNIAKGAMVGLGDYGDALKEFKKSAKERNKAMAEIENARRAEAKGDLKDTQMYEDKANDYLRASKRHGIDAIINATGKSAEVSASIYKEMLQQSGANARTNAQIAAGKGPGQQEHLFKTLGGGDVKAGLGYYAGIMGPEAKGEQAILAKYSGPQGAIALQMLEASGPEGKAQAQIIRQALKQSASSMLKPVNVAEALP
jgi:hypothetical protein